MKVEFREHLFHLIMPVLMSDKLLGKPKIFILQYCRGSKWIFMATDGTEDDKSQSPNSPQPSHLLDDCIFLHSTSDGNPAIRDKVIGSNFIHVSKLLTSKT